MTKTELIRALDQFEDDQVIVVADENGSWDNIEDVGYVNGTPTITFGGGSPFSAGD